MDGAVSLHTLPPPHQPYGEEPFLRRKNCDQHIRRRQNQDLSRRERDFKSQGSVRSSISGA